MNIKILCLFIFYSKLVHHAHSSFCWIISISKVRLFCSFPHRVLQNMISEWINYWIFIYIYWILNFTLTYSGRIETVTQSSVLNIFLLGFPSDDNLLTRLVHLHQLVLLNKLNKGGGLLTQPTVYHHTSHDEYFGKAHHL